jgi:hypothetical protein
MCQYLGYTVFIVSYRSYRSDDAEHSFWPLYLLVHIVVAADVLLI